MAEGEGFEFSDISLEILKLVAEFGLKYPRNYPRKIATEHGTQNHRLRIVPNSLTIQTHHDERRDAAPSCVLRMAPRYSLPPPDI